MSSALGYTCLPKTHNPKFSAACYARYGMDIRSRLQRDTKLVPSCGKSEVTPLANGTVKKSLATAPSRSRLR